MTATKTFNCRAICLKELQSNTEEGNKERPSAGWPFLHDRRLYKTRIRMSANKNLAGATRGAHALEEWQNENSVTIW